MNLFLKEIFLLTQKVVQIKVWFIFVNQFFWSGCFSELVETPDLPIFLLDYLQIFSSVSHNLIVAQNMSFLHEITA